MDGGNHFHEEISSSLRKSLPISQHFAIDFGHVRRHNSMTCKDTIAAFFTSFKKMRKI